MEVQSVSGGSVGSQKSEAIGWTALDFFTQAGGEKKATLRNGSKTDQGDSTS